MKEITHAISHSVKRIKRVFVLIVGVTILIIGIAMIILPGPAVIVIPIGLAVLGTEFLWARRALSKIKRRSSLLRDSVVERIYEGARRGK